MRISCREVIREISNYLEGEVDAGLRALMEDHLKGCAHCSAILDGTRNVVRLVGDGRIFEVPKGFGDRLRQRLASRIPETPPREH